MDWADTHSQSEPLVSSLEEVTCFLLKVWKEVLPSDYSLDGNVQELYFLNSGGSSIDVVRIIDAIFVQFGRLVIRREELEVEYVDDRMKLIQLGCSPVFYITHSQRLLSYCGMLLMMESTKST